MRNIYAFLVSRNPYLHKIDASNPILIKEVSKPARSLHPNGMQNRFVSMGYQDECDPGHIQSSTHSLKARYFYYIL